MNQTTKTILRRYQSVIALIIFSIIIAMLNDRFMTFSNIMNILRQTSINSIIAAGMTFVILTGGIDLSVGSTLAFSGAMVAWFIASGMNPLLAIVLALAIGTAIGVLNGIVISKGKLQPFIVTLATMTVFRGATLVFTDGKPISTGYESNAEFLTQIGNGYLGVIPIPIVIMIFVFAIGYYILTQTSFGRYVYALGGNEDATKLSGINTNRLKIIVYGMSGLFAALAGVIITARLSSAQPTAGQGYELDAIAAVVLGGTSLAGGLGTIMGTVTGALIIGILNNALNLMNVSSYYQLLAKGVVILIAVLIDRKEK
ncbi:MULTISPECIES: ribose ABC transporter permease [unclassified Fusibacter]|uniref:ribose ABC transporter permease n=1 Tax=unclassified Fusibacter TaxID=2624464 RepID=UPI0010116AF5|nr:MULTISPECIES: ribose ABC transporter permease [unclassified Fusibacter]MCK8060736.1 ribose ABC transporter permease [Fusibacter sp. A2]NPE23031.1 ribose ABC transporter permease [Fusibacter sp. A1]RXV59705.1 ribose ABC transporter permease [Fusibacter sp. A1]